MLTDACNDSDSAYDLPIITTVDSLFQPELLCEGGNETKLSKVSKSQKVISLIGAIFWAQKAEKSAGKKNIVNWKEMGVFEI